jgi:hypothetical protein
MALSYFRLWGSLFGDTAPSIPLDVDVARLAILVIEGDLHLAWGTSEELSDTAGWRKMASCLNSATVCVGDP